MSDNEPEREPSEDNNAMQQPGSNLNFKLSKYDKERQKKALIKRKEAFTSESGVMGRKLDGPAFESTPRIIEFRDFTVNEPHLKTIVLTNVSPGANYFKILPIEDEFRVVSDS